MAGSEDTQPLHDNERAMSHLDTRFQILKDIFEQRFAAFTQKMRNTLEGIRVCLNPLPPQHQRNRDGDLPPPRPMEHFHHPQPQNDFSHPQPIRPQFRLNFHPRQPDMVPSFHDRQASFPPTQLQRTHFPKHFSPVNDEESSDEEITEWFGPDTHNGNQGNYNGNQGNYKMKMDFSTFDGSFHIEDFLDWIRIVENFFKYMGIPEQQHVKLVAYKLRGNASVWWDQVKYTIRREGKRAVQTLSKMKQLLRKMYLPPDYEHLLYQ